MGSLPFIFPFTEHFVRPPSIAPPPRPPPLPANLPVNSAAAAAPAPNEAC